jgi:hypothetical protein
MYTKQAAFATHREGEIGSLAHLAIVFAGGLALAQHRGLFL